MGIAFPTPDEGILARREAITAGLARLVPPGGLVTAEDERRAFETDAFTAYRRMPLAVVLPSTTEEVASELRITPRFLQPMLMELYEEGKVVYQQKTQPRRKYVLLWRVP